MNRREPTGEDIANLLLLCAPPEVLSGFDLTEENQSEFIEDYDSLEASSRNDFYKISLLAQALYYANRTHVNFIKSYLIVCNIYISPEVIFNLTKIASSESFSETNDLKDEIRKQECGKGGKKTNIKNNQFKATALEYYEKNRHLYKSMKAAAEDICFSGNKTIVEQEFRAVNNWITNHNKKNATSIFKEKINIFSEEEVVNYICKQLVHVSPNIIAKWVLQPKCTDQ